MLKITPWPVGKVNKYASGLVLVWWKCSLDFFQSVHENGFTGFKL